jgi:hypothetical protein
LTTDIIFTDETVNNQGPCFWPHPPYLVAGFSDMHAEAVRVPDPVYKSALKPAASAGHGEGFIIMMWQVLDTRDYKRIRAIFP